MPRWVLAMWFLPIWSLRVGWEQHVSESSNHTWTSVLWVYPDTSKKQLSCNSQCLSHFTALFIVVGDETRNDSDNDTLIDDGSGMCRTSGPPGMSDYGPSKKPSEICEKTACRDACKGHQLRKEGRDKFRDFFLCLLPLCSSSVCLSPCGVVVVLLVLCCGVFVSRVVVCAVCVCVVWDVGKTTACTFKTPPCVPAPRPHVETRVRVVPANTVTFLNVHTSCMGDGGRSSWASLFFIEKRSKTWTFSWAS